MSGRQDAELLFIHGFRVSFDEAAKRTAQLSFDLRFPGVPMFYSWASAGSLGGYLADQSSVEWTVPHFQEFLWYAATELGAESIHVIAHSLGNRALIRALAEFPVEELPPGSAELQLR